MTARALLLVPPSDRIVIRDYYCSKTSQARYLHPPIDLSVQGGWLREAGMELTLVDATVERLGTDDALARAEAARPDAVFALAGAVSWAGDRDFLRAVAERTRAPVYASGDLFMSDPGPRMREAPFLAGVLRDFQSDELARHVRGETFERRALVLPGDDPGPVTAARGLRDLPVPAHDLFVGLDYRYPMARRTPIASVCFAYGCPFTCSFCISGELGTVVRSPENVLAELRALASLGVGELFLHDQCFGAPRAPYDGILDAMIAEGLDLGWWTFTRADVLDEALATRMKRAGCHTVILGVESADPEILANNRKGYSTDRIRGAFELCERVGLRTAATFILGLPEETEDTLQRTIDFACSLPADYASFNVAVPRAGTRLRREAVADGRVSDDLVEMDQSGTEPVLDTRGLDAEALKRWRRRAVLSFYARPRYLWRRLRHVRSGAEFRNQLREGFWLLRNAVRG